MISPPSVKPLTWFYQARVRIRRISTIRGKSASNIFQRSIETFQFYPVTTFINNDMSFLCVCRTQLFGGLLGCNGPIRLDTCSVHFVTERPGHDARKILTWCLRNVPENLMRSPGCPPHWTVWRTFNIKSQNLLPALPRSLRAPPKTLRYWWSVFRNKFCEHPIQDLPRSVPEGWTTDLLAANLWLQNIRSARLSLRV